MNETNTMSITNRKQLLFYGFFTKYSLLDNYGFFSGLFSRISLKFLPQYLPDNSIELIISQIQKENDGKVPMSNFMTYVNHDCKFLSNELYQSIISLSSKITAFGLDRRIKDKLDLLDFDANLFLELTRICTQIDVTPQQNIINVIEELKVLVEAFRKGKNKIGTSIQLTYKTSLLIKYLERISLLVRLKYNLKDQDIWNKIIQDYTIESKKHRSLLSYVKYHFDLLLLQIVEHTSFKGEKYIASNRTEYKEVFVKSMKAGVVISIFACCKLILDQWGMSNIKSALIFGINYALCFVIVKEIGGIIATKQPAMTASTIAKKIDGNNDLKIDKTSDVIGLVKDVSRTQTMSFLGNVIIVIPCSFILINILDYIGFSLIDEKQIQYLEKAIDPTNWKNIYYAAIAGLLLSFSGLVAGFVDNRVRFSRLQQRLETSKLMSNLFNSAKTILYSDKISKNLGAHIGNISLGLLLGMAFLVEAYLGLPFDIRHIAFSGSYLGVLIGSYSLSISGFLFLFLGVGLIGFTNFIISFSLTLFITFKTRGITFQEFVTISNKLLVDFVKDPVSYFLFKRDL